MAKYASTSLYSSTPVVNSQYLDILKIRSVPSSDNDTKYIIQPQYQYRPDLLSYDLYGSPKLWWVFAQRNMDILKDPVFDFVAGTEIFLPRESKLREFLGY